ncbi:hypothetical protein CBR_g39263 [Chara braunii]|uniref:Cytosol aminopeptidase domain-containing protein n=1 Tax=Chara braunii TaxID=69332 RepID=A0A388K0Y0_CHABU|nr:hypothetical protein CBR_g39263 [Chara braunii]|eukprot:GBG63721.1 hypothetical protein CBR_g39263 [Chara braunii]
MGSFSAAAAESVALLQAGTRGGQLVVGLTAKGGINASDVSWLWAATAWGLPHRNSSRSARGRQRSILPSTKCWTNLFVGGKGKAKDRVVFAAVCGCCAFLSTLSSSSELGGRPRLPRQQHRRPSFSRRAGSCTKVVRCVWAAMDATTPSSSSSTTVELKSQPCDVSSETETETETLGLTKPSTPLIPTIRFSVSSTPVATWAGDVLALLVWEETMTKDKTSGKFLDAELANMDDITVGLLGEIVAEGDFKGKTKQSIFTRLVKGSTGLSCKRIGLVGLGKRKSDEELENDSALWRGAGAVLASVAKGCTAHSAAVQLLLGSGEGCLAGLSSSKARGLAAKGLSSGVILACFEDTRFKKSDSKKLTLESVEVLGFEPGAEVDAAFQMAVKVCDGVMLTRQLVNAPANVLTPGALADVAVGIATKHADVLSATILEKSDCEKLGMGAFLGVAAASTLPPKFIHLKYSPPSGKSKKRLAMIGKGLTFDSGGYNLKPRGSSIDVMKFDMGGAGAVLGAAEVIGSVKPEGVEVHFIAAACENMVSGWAMRPGDILTASNGKTIEVNNTDAEGRLTLADGLVYACKLEVDAIVDVATLTGACKVALGTDICGMFTTSDIMAEELRQAARLAGEKLWRLPMEEGYRESIKSSVADMLNSGGRHGGAIIAALFLKEFVKEGIPWAHLDIAGPAWNGKKSLSTGFGVCTLVEWVSAHSRLHMPRCMPRTRGMNLVCIWGQIHPVPKIITVRYIQESGSVSTPSVALCARGSSSREVVPTQDHNRLGSAHFPHSRGVGIGIAIQSRSQSDGKHLAGKEQTAARRDTKASSLSSLGSGKGYSRDNKGSSSSWGASSFVWASGEGGRDKVGEGERERGGEREREREAEGGEGGGSDLERKREEVEMGDLGTTGFNVVYVTVPNKEVGEKLARGLVEKRLAACVNILPGVESFYTWEGKMEKESELLLIIKTRVGLFEDVEKYVVLNHPYDVPELIALPIVQGSAKYVRWLGESTQDPAGKRA